MASSAWTPVDETAAKWTPVDEGQAAQAPPVGSIHAPEQPSDIHGRIAQWADDVANDLKNGTSITGVGHVLKALGARGLYAGNSEAVGDFMGSLPLGLLRNVKGQAQQNQGQLVQGAKNTALGALQAGTIPSAFVAPEAAEAASAAPGQAVRVASGASLKTAAGGLFKTVDAAAQDAGLVINVEKPGQVALEILKNKQEGGQMQAGIRQFLERVTGKDQAPVTYQSARNFYSNLNRLSTQDINRLAPNTQRLLRSFVSALDDSLRDATATIGQENNYAQAMQQYAQGARRAELFSALTKKYLPAAGLSAAAGTAFEVARRKVGKTLADLLTTPTQQQ